MDNPLPASGFYGVALCPKPEFLEILINSIISQLGKQVTIRERYKLVGIRIQNNRWLLGIKEKVIENRIIPKF